MTCRYSTTGPDSRFLQVGVTSSLYYVLPSSFLVARYHKDGQPRGTACCPPSVWIFRLVFFFLDLQHRHIIFHFHHLYELIF